MSVSERAIVFGARGTLGAAIADELFESGIDVIRVTRAPVTSRDWISTSEPGWSAKIEPPSFSRIIFAQGQNSSGGILQVPSEAVREAMDANVISTVDWIKSLNESLLLDDPARVCIVGSVWANVARQEKLAYTISKTAVSGLVRSLCADLSGQGISVNAIFPGILDSPMTRQHLSPASMSEIESQTPSGSLVLVKEIAKIASWLTSSDSRGISGQCIVADNGWSVARYV